MSNPVHEDQYPREHTETLEEGPNESYDKNGRPFRETLNEYLEKIGEGAKRLPEKLREEGAAIASYFSGPADPAGSQSGQ